MYKDLIYINNRIFYFSIKKIEHCLFSRREGHAGIRIFGHSIIFLLKNKYGIQ
jgi:hypothetical protein